MAAEPPTAGARSTTSTSAPASLAAVAAHIPAIPAPRTTTSTATSAATQLLGHGRDDRQRVADDPEVGQLEDRRVAILVDCDHAPRAADADDVLRRAADADGDVHLRADSLAGLSDLQRGGDPAGVDDRTRDADRGVADCARELLEQHEVGGISEPAPAPHHDPRILEPYTVALLLVPLQPPRAPALGRNLDVDGNHLGLASGRLGREGARTYEHQPRRATRHGDVDGLGPADPPAQVSGPPGPDAERDGEADPVGREQVVDVRDERRPEQRLQPPRDVAGR